MIPGLLRTPDLSCELISVTDLTADALLFDLDGVLVDSISLVEKAWRKFAARNDLSYESIADTLHGRRTIDVLASLLPASVLEEEAVRFEELELSLATGTAAIPGAQELLNELLSEAWAVVTSGGQQLARARLNAAHLPVPEVLIAAGDVRRGKPDPAGYLLAASRLEVRPEQCVVLEDTPAGVSAAVQAGAVPVGLTTTDSASTLRGAGCMAIVRDLTKIAVTQSVVTSGLRSAHRYVLSLHS